MELNDIFEELSANFKKCSDILNVLRGELDE